ncbi:MAG TPA: hypothetical protein VMU48_19930 [Terracidiphilus sp.]|nr:hypothetical protein [Terracidiphilus sp.]
MRNLLKILAVIAIVCVVYVLVERGVMSSWIHVWVQYHFGDLTGSDQTVGWLVTLAILALTRLVRWRRLMLAPLTGGTKAVLGFATICLAAAGAMKFTNARILFDSSGNPRQSYVETVYGPVIQDAPPGSIDPKTGLKRQALTADVLRAIDIGKSQSKDTTGRDPNHYFSASDGKYKVWFVEGSCEIRNEDGYDDRGQRLIPATAELVDHCEKLQAEAEEQRKREAQQQARRDLLEQRWKRRHEFQEIGTYTAAGRFTVIDGVKIAFEQCEVLRHLTRLKFRIANLGTNGQFGNPPGGRFEFSLLNSDGTETRQSGIHRVQGLIAIFGQDNDLLSSAPGESAQVVVDFQRDSESGGFAIAINHAVAFTNPASHIVNFRQF